MDINNELAAALAHEIKNPIAIIRANIDYIKLSVNPSLSNCFNVIEKELNKLNSLITDYTTIFQPNNKNELIFMEDLIYDVAEEFNIITSKEIHFTFNINSEIKLMGDYKKLSILLFNIYKNSVEAIKEKGTISTKMYQKNNNIYIEISDTGCGIPDDLINNIGTPFLTTKANGSGLGIMICKTIVDAHNGKIFIENTKKGCKTTIEFHK
ncbi:MAG: ATP-binding protein [Lachnospirales bacterium]